MLHTLIERETLLKQMQAAVRTLASSWVKASITRFKTCITNVYKKLKVDLGFETIVD